VTWLHGFPISSWDWVKLHGALRSRRRDVTLDFLGFGASAKSKRHRYSIVEQADLVVETWRHHGVRRTAVVAHDYGVSVAQELMARRDEGALDVELTRLVFLNGGLFPALHRPTRIQKALAGRLGPVVARLMNENGFVASYREVLGQPPDDAELREHWRAFSRDHGHHNVHALLGYIAERRLHEDRWVGALIDSDLPKHFVWGPEDPVSGAHVLPEIEARVPGAQVTVLDGLGHAPHMEAPERVAAVLSDLL
jgi:pimeloyl-ACP methyl ester carboxylesterase